MSKATFLYFLMLRQISKCLIVIVLTAWTGALVNFSMLVSNWQETLIISLPYEGEIKEEIFQKLKRRILSLFGWQIIGLIIHMWCSARFSTICTIWKTWKIPMEECYFYHKSNTPSWVFFTFFKLHKWYQIAESISSPTLPIIPISFVSFCLTATRFAVQMGFKEEDLHSKESV